MLWADSVIYKDVKEILGSPVIEVEHWVNAPPKDYFKGKFILVEVWATWCPPCRRSLALLEYYHKKYPQELAVVSINETDEKALKEMKSPMKLADIHTPLAVDTHRRFANSLGVYGIPHCVLIDPIFGKVVWEGMPTQIGYELSDERLSKILANLKNPKVIELLPKEPPVSFKVCPPDPKKPNKQPNRSTRSIGEEE
jgi:thiol-disulfide isomerase/thioredoxin